MIKLGEIFQNGMMLQRGKDVHIFGTADPGCVIRAKIQGKNGEAAADETGHFDIVLSGLEASDSETLTVEDGETVLRIDDVAIGEIWIAAGQSNMEFHLGYEKHWQEEQDHSDINLRFYDVPEVAFRGQREAFDYQEFSVWRKADKSESMQYFSAAGYYFQKMLREELHIPIGIVGLNWGGTRSASWMRKESVLPQWDQRFQEETRDIIWDKYWQDLMTCPESDRGHPFANPVWNLMMYATPSVEEIYLKSMECFGGMEMPGDPLYEPKDIPGCLLEHMVKTITPFTTRGVLWYQGESDDAIGMQELYEQMLTLLIRDWREEFKDAALPFLIVQLPGFERWLHIEDMDYMTIRSCQEEVTRQVENTWLCSISDGGEQFDIHPKDKKLVGERLAALALRHIYEKDVPADPPVLKEAAFDGTIIRLSFENAGDGLYAAGERIEGLSVYGKDDTEIPFDHEILKDTITLHCHQEPRSVRYLKKKWFQSNLFNAAGIPAIPFEAGLQ